jgi:hypothetical protein
LAVLHASRDTEKSLPKADGFFVAKKGKRFEGKGMFGRGMDHSLAEHSSALPPCDSVAWQDWF